MNSLLAAAIAAGVLWSMIKNANPYDAFLRGAGEGMTLMLKTAPNIFAAALCAGMLEKSGLFAFLAHLLAPAFGALGLPQEIFPLFLVRPVSGSAALAVVEQILRACGPDSFAARTACAMMGSTETVFYTIAVYTAGMQIPKKSMRRITAVCLITCVTGGFFAAWICAI